MFMFTPLFVAISSSLLLRQPRAPGVYLTLLVAIGGSAMVISGKWLEDAAADSSGLAAEKTSAVNLAVGLLLSFACTLLMTAYMLALQVSRSLVTNEQVLMANRNITLLVFVPLALGIEGTEFAWLWALKPMDIGVLLGSAIVIYTGANLLLQMCTRSVGANLVSVFISLRLVGSIVGEIVLLKDTPQHWLTWLGFACVIVTMTAFLCYQQYMGRQQVPVTDSDDVKPAAETAGAAAADAVSASTAAATRSSQTQDVDVDVQKAGCSSSSRGNKAVADVKDAAIV
jgi:drug/metabolite transporter (DMT)-like permease